MTTFPGHSPAAARSAGCSLEDTGLAGPRTEDSGRQEAVTHQDREENAAYEADGEPLQPGVEAEG